MKHPVLRTSTALGLSLSLLQPGIAPAQEAAIDPELRALCGALPEGVLEQILEDAEAEEQAPAETPPPAEAPPEGHSQAPDAAAEPVAEPAPAAEAGRGLSLVQRRAPVWPPCLPLLPPPLPDLPLPERWSDLPPVLPPLPVGRAPFRPRRGDQAPSRKSRNSASAASSGHCRGGC